ncbi:MAG: hypothetical protein DRN12_07545 [Thermoplasmata archaeon]|nr:MAG: hypothetical protein DRN12_07545 [Thermoplasmata archaeon]
MRLQSFSLFKRAVTLVELIVVIIILGIGISALLATLGDITRRAYFSEEVADATFYAQEMMERVKSKSFQEIDDLEGKDNPAPGYEREVAVDYAQLSEGRWSTASGVTSYKMVRVSVSKSGYPAITIVTIVSDY